MLFLAHQTIEYQSPPAHEYVLRGTVRAPGPVHVPGQPSDCRLVLQIDGDDVYEVATLQAAGDGTFTVETGAPSATSALRLDLLGRTELLGLRVNGGPYVPLLDAAAFQGWHRRPGACLATARFHKSLGGAWATYWVTLRADARQFDIALLWHQAIPGPNVSVSSVEVVTPLPWRPSLPDPACSGRYLVKPGSYVLQQQRGRIFRFSVGPDARPDYVGTSDSWYSGGYGPGGLPLPAETSLPRYPLAEARHELANLLPVESWEPSPWNVLWPANGERSADGHTHEIQPLYGSRWAVSRGDPGALEFFQIEQLRAQARASIRLGADGQALRLDEYPRGWTYYDGFQGGEDAPWEWDRWTAPGYVPFADYGIGSYLQRLNENWTLVWLSNDPVARLLALEAATRARLTWWEIDPPPGPLLGSDIGQGEASGALAIFVARALGDRQYGAWIDSFVAHLRQAQMPSGCIVARRGRYPAQHAPFAGTDYALQGDLEFSLLHLAAYSFGAHDVVRNAARGMVGIATDDEVGDFGQYYFHPTGIGAQTRYFDKDDYPQALRDRMGEEISYYTSWSTGIPTALALAVDAPDAAELFARWQGSAAEMRSWELTAPDTHSGAPFDQWAALLGVLP